ncbi:FtsX-like permease family protein [Shimia thalassica]|uniref:FtsX-like permease family protein n=1 Tax=Shimia thalassica TaxID=1715693 RepID=A0A0P1IDE9_9RHOB|nr:FtsX-like permease family protein [Shimia thalassica]CUK06662.1 FtsX-like permease family protein [Shimia thalassica]
MNLQLAWKFAKRELRGGLAGFRIFLACLALGVATIAAIGSVRSSIEAGLAAEGASLLGGDAEMEFTYRFASDAEKAWMAENATKTSEIVDFRSMAVVTHDGVSERGLTQVKAVDDAYPLIGTVTLDPDIPLAEALAPQDGIPGGVMQKILIDRLGLTIGDTFTLGTQQFHLTAALVNEPDNAGGFGLAPRSIVATRGLAESGLLTPGTLYETKYRLDLPEGTALEDAKTQAQALFESSGLRWRDSRNGAPGVAQFVERLGAFLILVGLSGLAVGGIGVSAAIRAYLSRKTAIIAILRSLGAERQTIFLTYFLQIGVLSVCGVFLGLLLGAGLPLLLAPLLQSSLPVPAIFAIYPTPLIEAALYGLLTALIFTLWPLARTEDVRAAALFRDADGAARTLPAFRYIALTVFFLGVLLALAGWFSGSWQLTIWAAVGIMAALVLLAVAATLTSRIAKFAAPRTRKNPPLRWALNAISSSQEPALPVVLSLGLGLSVLSAVGQIDGNLRTAIARDLPEVAPSYFFVDIQKTQIDGFLERVGSDPAVSDTETAPMLRGLITKINGRPATEVAGGHWVVEGDRGVTYAASIPDTTTIVAGSWWPEDYTGPPQISFAAEEAEEMGLELGDTITLNVLGRDIKGTITSFREVDFSTAGMGFVMVMNPASLAGAPHSFIATVYAEEHAEAAILRDLSNTYPNVTAIRVRDAIARVSDLLSGLADATSYGASVMLVTGFLVLIGAAAASQTSRIYEAAILKTLGAPRLRILTSFALRAALTGAAAGSVALAAGIGGAWAVTYFVLDTGFSVIWPNAIAIILGGICATLLASLAFAAAPLAARPARILRARE